MVRRYWMHSYHLPFDKSGICNWSSHLETHFVKRWSSSLVIGSWECLEHVPRNPVVLGLPIFHNGKERFSCSYNISLYFWSEIIVYVACHYACWKSKFKCKIWGLLLISPYFSLFSFYNVHIINGYKNRERVSVIVKLFLTSRF